MNHTTVRPHDVAAKQSTGMGTVESPSRRVRVLAILLIGAVMLVCLGGAEWYLRSIGPKKFTRPSQVPGLSYELIPNFRSTYEGIDYRTNRYGFRGEDFPQDKPAGEYRILFLGDSMVFGGHVEEEESVGARLQALWNNHTGAPKTRVINAGVSSYNVKNYLAQYEHVGVTFNPDLVIVGLFLNDHFPFIAEDKIQGFKRTPAWWERSYLLTKVLMTYRRLLTNRDAQSHQSDPRFVQELSVAIPDRGSINSLFGFLQQRGYTTDLLASESILLLYDLPAWDQIRRPLEEMKALAASKSAKLQVVIFPVEYQLEDGFVYPEPQQRIREIGASLDIPVLDTLPVLKALQRRLGQPIYHRWGDIMHFNAAAHEAVAQEIFRQQRLTSDSPVAAQSGH